MMPFLRLVKGLKANSEQAGRVTVTPGMECARKALHGTAFGERERRGLNKGSSSAVLTRLVADFCKNICVARRRRFLYQ